MDFARIKNALQPVKWLGGGRIVMMGALVVGVYWAGMSVAIGDVNLWLVIAAIPAGFVLMKSSEIGFFAIMISVFFADWGYESGLIPAQLTWFPEIVLIFYSAKAVIKRRRFVRTPIDIAVAFFIIVGCISMLANSRSPISMLLALRLDLKFVLMFFLLMNLDIKEAALKRLLNVFLILLVIQVPVAFGKFLVYGQSEASVGTYAGKGGATSAILPVIAISIFAGFYLHEKSRISYILGIAGYVFFSIMAGKRGFIIYGFALILFLLFKIRGRLRRKLLPIMGICLCGFMLCIYLVPWLKPALDDPRYLLEYYSAYETQRDAEGKAGGRMSAIEDAYNALKKHPAYFLIGYGPGSTIKSFFKSFSARDSGDAPIDTVYGHTHLVTTAVEYGYVGFIIYFLWPLFLLYRMNSRFYRGVNDVYWKSISFAFSGIIFSYLLIGIFYWELLRRDVEAFIFWLLAAVIYGVGRERNIPMMRRRTVAVDRTRMNIPRPQ